MSKKNGETSTFEMETRETFDKVILAINGLRQDIVPRLDKLEDGQNEIRKEQTEIRKSKRNQKPEIRKEFTKFKNYVELQFEANRQGLVQNYQEILQLQKDAAENRMSNATIKSIVSELNERLYQMSKKMEQTL